MAELAAAGAGDSSGAGAIEFVDMIGGVSYIGPDQDTTAMVDLTEGTVMAMCYVPDAHGVAHALHGHDDAPDGVGRRPATGATADAEPPDEEVLGTIELAEDGYHVPDDLQAGLVPRREHRHRRLARAVAAAPRRADRRRRGGRRSSRTWPPTEPPQVELEAVGGMGAISAGLRRLPLPRPRRRRLPRRGLHARSRRPTAAHARRLPRRLQRLTLQPSAVSAAAPDRGRSGPAAISVLVDAPVQSATEVWMR